MKSDIKNDLEEIDKGYIESLEQKKEDLMEMVQEIEKRIHFILEKI
jgi:hypothetical protein